MSDTFEVTVERADEFIFEARFPGVDHPAIRMDEPPPLGDNAGPNAARLLAAAVGNCLSASLVFCLGKADVDPERVSTRVEGTLVRNDDGRLRVGGLDVEIDLDGADEQALKRCRDIFEDYCVVTASVRDGLDVDVHVDG